MFESARLKLERAQEHVRNLDVLFAAFMDARPHLPVIKDKRNDRGIWQMTLEISSRIPPPTEIGLVLGDAVHNFRCALDHMTWELIGSDGGTQDRYTAFPTGDTRINFESRVKGMITPRQDTKQFFVDLAVYPSGHGEILYGLHLLDNADKHCVITPTIEATVFDGITLIDMTTGERLPADPIDVPADADDRIFHRIPDGFGIDANNPIETTANIFFPEVDIFPFEPVTSTLAQIDMRVEHTIELAERLVAART